MYNIHKLISNFLYLRRNISIDLIFILSEAEVNDDRPIEDFEEEITSALPDDLEHIPLNFSKLSSTEILGRSEDFFNLMNKRRTVRHFSSETVPKEIIFNIIKTAGELF